MPCCLNALSQRLEAAYSVTELIDRFTLLPLYRPFLREKRYSGACTTMAGNSGAGLKMSLGITASRFQKHASLRFCEVCAREDAEACGTAYWHRIHQAIGNCVCPRHGQVLRAVRFPDGSDWRCMLLPDEAVGLPVMDSHGGTASLDVAQMQMWGLEHTSHVQGLLAGHFLRHRLDEMGFISSSRIREQALRAFLTPRLLISPSEDAFEEMVHSCDWIFQALRGRTAAVQPFKFYFLCWLLDVKLERLANPYPIADSDLKGRSRGSASASPAPETQIELHRLAFSSSANLRCHDKPGYAWLYRHDRKWLAQYVASHPFVRSRQALIDWDARDLALADELAIANDLIRSVEGKPQKVTRAALSRRVANGHDFLRNPHLFPLSTSLLHDLLESDHDHQIRKIMWAAKNYSLSEGAAISVVHRYAGIRVSHVIEAEITTLLTHKLL